MKDAIGNELCIGNKYGYTITAKGITEVKLGILVNIGIEKATIEVREYRRWIYSELTTKPLELLPSGKFKKVSIRPFNLYPIVDDYEFKN